MRQPSTLQPVPIVDGEVVTGDGQPPQEHQEKTATGQLESSATRDATGRELDALVAVKVMGWSRGPATNPPNRHWPLDESRAWRAPFAPHARALPHYSTDYGDAWLVVDAMYARGWYATLRYMTDGFVAEFDNLTHTFVAHVDPRDGGIALAICHAALAATTRPERASSLISEPQANAFEVHPSSVSPDTATACRVRSTGETAP